MRALLLISFLFLADFARAAEYPLEGGVSPNRAYKVVLIDGGAGEDAIRYAVRSRRSGRLLLTIPSSYQREGDAEFGWPLRKSSGAGVVWNCDSSLVAIDEDVHRYIGNLFLVYVARDRATPVDLRSESIERAAHQPWDRVSIHKPEWTSARSLQVYLHGLLPASPTVQSVHKEFNVVLEVGRNQRVRIKRIEEINESGT